MKYVSNYQKLYIIGKLNQFPVHTTTKNPPDSIAAPLVAIFHFFDFLQFRDFGTVKLRHSPRGQGFDLIPTNDTYLESS